MTGICFALNSGETLSWHVENQWEVEIIRRNQNVTEAEWACWAPWLQSHGQGHIFWSREPHRGNNDISRDWNKAMYSFSYPYGLLKHTNNSGILHHCFVDCLEEVHKLSEKKGQGLNGCFGKSASLGRIWQALFTVRESSTYKSSETPREPSSKSSRDKARHPKYFSLSKNKQQQQKSRKLNPRPSLFSTKNYEAGFFQRSL